MERGDIGDLLVGQPHYRKDQNRPWSKQIIGSDLLRRGLQSDNKAFPAPEFYIVNIDKALGLLDCLSIVGANQRFEPREVPVMSNEVSPILCHP
jgi:hypothetical protein